MDQKGLKAHFENLDDNRLVDWVRSQKPGWHTVASHLLNRHRTDVMNRCRGWLGNQHDAEDATQETLFRAYRALSGFNGDASFRTWVFAIADNNCRSAARRRARHAMSDHLRNVIALHEEMVRQRNSRNEDRTEYVNFVLEHLPTKSKEILVLRFFQDFSLDEIAQTLGLGLSATKMRLYRSLQQFKERYFALDAKAA